MKASSFIILPIAVAALLGACKPIPESDRFIENKTDNTVGRSVLIEDYTGANCVNCPVAANAITKAAAPHGDKVVIVAMHGDNTPHGIGTFEAMDPMKLYNDVAKEYLTTFEVGAAFPAAIFNRTPLASNSGKYFSGSFPAWAGEMQHQRALPQLYTMSLTAKASGRNVEVSCSATATEHLTESKDLKLQLWLIEDNIVAPQNTHKGVVSDYTHNHIFRQALNGNWGEDYKVGDNFSKTFAIDNDIVKVKNSAVVAFVYDAKTKEVYEVTKVHLNH